MKMLFYSSCLNMRHCLWEASSGDRVEGMSFLLALACPDYLRFNNKPWKHRLSMAARPLHFKMLDTGNCGDFWVLFFFQCL